MWCLQLVKGGRPNDISYSTTITPPAPYVFPKHFLTEREEYVQGIKLKTTGTSIIF
jgi:hypothetical protein